MSDLAVNLALQNIRLQSATPGKRVTKPAWPQVWRYPQGVEEDYAKAIKKILAPYFRIVAEELIRAPQWLKTDLRMDAFAADWDASMKRLRAAQRSMFEEGDGRDVYAMVTGFAEASNGYNMREWAKYLTSLAGQPYYPPAEEWVAQTLERWSDVNFELIRSLTDDYIKQVNVAVVDAVTTGATQADLTKSIMKVNSNISKARATLIARDQVGKLNGEFAGRRQKEAGVEAYTWKASDDERVRSTHKNMHGKVCKWADASVVKDGAKWTSRSGSMANGHPGYEIQCRCYSSPNLDEIWAEATAIAKAEGWYDDPLAGLTMKKGKK